MRLDDTRDRDRAVELEVREDADRAGNVVEPEVPDLCSAPISDELDRSALSRRRTGMGAVVEGVTDVVRPRCRREEGGADRSGKERCRHQAAEVRPTLFHLLPEGCHIRGPNSTAPSTQRPFEQAIKPQRETGRQMRAEIPVPSLALVGYTNAGKSTLFRALTGADAYVADQLFATLDTTTRRVHLPNGEPLLLSDTVGFIRQLPHTLVAAFRATLAAIAYFLDISYMT